MTPVVGRIAFCHPLSVTHSSASCSFSHSLTPRHVRPKHLPQTAPNAKRLRHLLPVLSVEPVDGGPVPEPEDPTAPTPKVQFFAPDTTSVPNVAPSLTPDPPTAVELPLFPLQLVANPGTNVPLHIFEMRYRLMFKRLREAPRDEQRFGIVMLDSKAQHLALVGCTAHITRFDPVADGRIFTNNIAKQRFRILRIIEEKPYLRAKVEMLHDDNPTENILPALRDVWQALQDVLRLSNKLYDKELQLSPDLQRLAPPLDTTSAASAESASTTGGSVGAGGGDARASDGGLGPMAPREGESVPEGWPSPAGAEEFSFAVSQMLEMSLTEQQVMLQMTETAARLRRQLFLLTNVRQYLAAQVTIKEAGLKDI